jgi:hypothetical protein
VPLDIKQEYLRVIKQLKAGIRATKFHYTKKKIQDCTLRLSDDLTTLFWEYDNQYFSSEVMRRFCTLEDIESMIYGPHSYTFKAYRMQHLIE